MSAPTGPCLDDVGTPESTWRDSPLLGGLPLLEAPPPERAVIVAPHPDDEVLGCGGLMCRLSHAGTQLTVLAVTAGEASHPNSPSTTPGQLASLRAAEVASAYARLGIAVDRVELSIPDGRTAEVVDVIAAAIHR